MTRIIHNAKISRLKSAKCIALCYTIVHLVVAKKMKITPIICEIPSM